MRGKRIPAQAAPARRLAAILAAGVNDYGLMPEGSKAETRQRIGHEKRRLRSALAAASGAMFGFHGNGLMAEFSSATEALKCALRFQASATQRMTGVAEPIRFRMAINAGEIVANNRHISGAAVTLADRLRRIAPAGGIVLPSALYDQVRQAVPVTVSPMGQPDLQDGVEAVAVVCIPDEACVAWVGGTAIGTSAVAQPAAADPRASLAVIPFRATGIDASFAASAADDVIRALGGLTTWLAVTRTQAASIHAPLDLQKVRQMSGARYVLHGSAETERDMLQLMIELNEAESGRVLWSDRFGHLPDEQAALRADAASRSARAIPPLLFQRERDRSALAHPDTLRSHDLALQAYGLIMQPARETFFSAAEMLRQADKRPGPHASTGFARVWWHLMAVSQGWSDDRAADIQAADRAAAGLDRNDPAAMALLGFMHSVVHQDHALGSAMLDRVIDTAPGCGLAASLKGLTLSWMGQAQTAIFHAERAETMPALGPERAWRDYVTALAHYVATRYGEAVGWARMSAMHYPGLAENARVLAASLVVQGRLDEAHQATRQVLMINPGFRIEAWRRGSMLPEACRDTFAQRLRLAGLPA